MAAGVRENSIIHPTHPPHPLAKLCSEAEYLCNGCHTLGVGTSYCCQSCNFNLHDYCARCPTSLLLSSMHPHPLTLVARDPHHERFCNLCGSHVQGIFFYSCKLCDFDLHPICTQLPEQLSHVLDPAHPLSLQQPPSVPACCAVCRKTCTSWHYGCGVCCLHIHLDCVLEPCDPPTRHRSFPPPPPYGDFAHYGYWGLHGHTPYNNAYGYHANYNHPPQPQPSGGYGYGYGPFGYGYGYGVLDHAYTHYHGHVNYYQPQLQAHPYYDLPQPLAQASYYQHQHQPQAQASYYQPQPLAQASYYQHQPQAQASYYQPQPQAQPNYSNPQPQAQSQSQSQGGGTTNWGLAGKIFGLVGSLASGVLSNMIFGMITSPSA